MSRLVAPLLFLYLLHAARAKWRVSIHGSASFVGDGFQHGPFGSATYSVLRDAAAPALLPDGRSIVVYGDTATLHATKNWFFLINSAALTKPGNPHEVEEALIDGARPHAVLPWTHAERALHNKDGKKQYVGVWPAGVAYIPTERRIIISYHKFLVKSLYSYDYLGQGVAEYKYVSAEKALKEGIVATRLNDDLFHGDNVHMSSPTYYNGMLYFFGCQLGSIRCYAARVSSASVATDALWQWWNGSNFEGGIATRKFLVQSDGLPLGEFSVPNVQYLPAYGAYVMAHGQGTDVTVLRWARTPEGPWSPPQRLLIPGCAKNLNSGGCYGNAVWPESTKNELITSYAAHGYLDPKTGQLANKNLAVRTRVAKVAVTQQDF